MLNKRVFTVLYRYPYCLNNPLKYSDPSGMLMAPANFGRDIDAYQNWLCDVAAPWHYGGGGGGGGHSSAGWGGADPNWAASYIYGSNVKFYGYYDYSKTGAYISKYDGHTASFDEYYANKIAPDLARIEQQRISNFLEQCKKNTTVLNSMTASLGLGGQILRPAFSLMLANYPGKLTSADVYKLIGGKVYQNYLNNPTAYQNSCSLRLSYALNASGASIPFISGQTGSGDDGNWYFYRVSNLTDYLSTTYGPPDLVGNSATFAGQNGIILFQDCGWSDATGHLDLWNGSSCSGHCYWDQCGSASLWTLP